MNPQNTLLFDPDSCLRQELQTTLSTQLGLKFKKSKSLEQLYASLSAEQPDLIMLDIKLPNVSGLEVLKQFRSRHWGGPVLFLGCAPIEDLRQTDDARIDFVRIPIDQDELEWRILKLITVSLSEQTDDIQAGSKILVPSVQELRNKATGRLDAERISDVFGITMADLARCIARSPQSVHKTPDAASIQSMLFHFERIAHVLIRTTGSLKSLRVWLNTPNPRFEKTCPIEFLKKGKLELLANIVESALLGQPG